jgi:transcriptional regulator with XRE-family HTH domain
MPNHMDTQKSWNSAPSARMAKRGGPETDQAQRLRLLRKALGFDTQEAFAAHVGLEHKRYANYENGYPLPREAVLTLVSKVHGLSIDWLYLGKDDGLSLSLSRRLLTAESSTDNSGLRGRRRA